jgi:hypothetical protein
VTTEPDAASTGLHHGGHAPAAHHLEKETGMSSRTPTTHLRDDVQRPSAATIRGIVTISLVTLLAIFSTVSAARADVSLGTTADFAILAGQSVTNTGSTTIYGDIGIHPGAAVAPNVTGYGSITHTGTLHDTGSVAAQAKADLVVAYDDAAARTPTLITRELATADLGPGVYASNDGGDFLLSENGTLTLTGGADDVWIFQSASTVIFESASSIVLVGADPCNVFWQVTSSATLGTGAVITGTIMAMQDISLQTGATLDGRALAREGSVTLEANTITIEPCLELVAAPEAETEAEVEAEPDEAPPAETPATEQEAVPVETPDRVDTGAGGTAPRSGDAATIVAIAALAVLAARWFRSRPHASAALRS